MQQKSGKPVAFPVPQSYRSVTPEGWLLRKQNACLTIWALLWTPSLLCVFQTGNFLGQQLISSAPHCLRSQGLSGGHLAFEIGEGGRVPWGIHSTLFASGRDFSLFAPNLQALPTSALKQLGKMFPKGKKERTLSRKSLFF